MKLTDLFKKASITLPIEIGDTVLFGRFKNIPKIVKEISVDKNNQPTINGKPILSIRIKKLMKNIKHK